jgi:hypothetical protein
MSHMISAVAATRNGIRMTTVACQRALCNLSPSWADICL